LGRGVPRRYTPEQIAAATARLAAGRAKLEERRRKGKPVPVEREQGETDELSESLRRLGI
jgi:hypothetical protein